MRNIDLGSWQAALSTLLGVALFALVGIGIRLLLMMTVQQRRERMNRQINERLKLLIAAYKTLGGSFTGNLLVDPRHLRDFREEGAEAPGLGWERCRQIRDAVEGALSDILLLGTEEQVRLAGRARQGRGGKDRFQARGWWRDGRRHGHGPRDRPHAGYGRDRPGPHRSEIASALVPLCRALASRCSA